MSNIDTTSEINSDSPKSLRLRLDPRAIRGRLPTGQQIKDAVKSAADSARPPEILNQLPTGQQVSERITKVREDIGSAGARVAEAGGRAVEVSRPHIEEAARRAQDIARQAPEAAGQAIKWSRNSRLATEAKNRKRNPIQRFFATGTIGLVARSIAQAIPSPAWYGLGDVITGTSAVLGRDVLTGDHLDKVDRVLYGVATAIPIIPATVLLAPARLIRKSIEEAMHASRAGQSKDAVLHARTAFEAGKEIASSLKQARK